MKKTTPLAIASVILIAAIATYFRSGTEPDLPMREPSIAHTIATVEFAAEPAVHESASVPISDPEYLPPAAPMLVPAPSMTREALRNELVRMGNSPATETAIAELKSLAPFETAGQIEAVLDVLIRNHDGTTAVADLFAPAFTDALTAKLASSTSRELGRILFAEWNAAHTFEDRFLRARLESLDIPAFHAERARSAAETGDSDAILEALARLETNRKPGTFDAIASLANQASIPLEELVDTAANWAASAKPDAASLQSRMTDPRASDEARIIAAVSYLATSGTVKPVEKLAAEFETNPGMLSMLHAALAVAAQGK